MGLSEQIRSAREIRLSVRHFLRRRDKTFSRRSHASSSVHVRMTRCMLHAGWVYRRVM